MERENNNTGLTVVITLLVVAVLGLTGFIVYDKVLRDDINNSNNDDVLTQEFISIEKLKQNVSKVIGFDNLNEDVDYLKLTKNGNLTIGMNRDSSLYQKYSKEYEIAKDILDVYLFSVGNGGYQYIYALKKDGTIDRMEIASPAKYSNFEWETNYKGLKNIIYLDLYSKDSPRLLNDQGETFEVYDQTITAVDVEGNIYSLDQVTESVYVQKQNKLNQEK